MRRPAHTKGRQCGIGEVAAAKSESERPRGKSCAQHQTMLFGPADPVRRKLPADSWSEFRGAL